MRPCKTLSDNAYWNELACLSRLTLVANYLPRHATHAQLYVPEAAHFVSLLAGTGQLLVRTSVYGVVVNLLHSMYLAKSASGETSVSPEIQALLTECAAPATLKMFGLRRPTPTSDYALYDPVSDMQYLTSLEHLSLLLVRIMEATAGSRGELDIHVSDHILIFPIALLNVWRARWMSLITSSAFQLSPAVQSRAFVALGVLATSDVDDDLLYQMLVAFKTALSQASETDTTSVVSMLRCITNVVPATNGNSRYLAALIPMSARLGSFTRFLFTLADANDHQSLSLEKG